jgi:alpha-amylase
MMSSASRILLLILSFNLVLFINAASKDAWRSRSIYQVMIDRFARTDGSTTFPCNVTDRIYCGGTWKGLQNSLDYIQGMGFDAIWISPISHNIEGMTGDGEGYTGYWVTDMTSLNSHFGTSDDLIELSREVHTRGT